MRTIVLTYFGPVLVDYRPLFFCKDEKKQQQVSARFKASGKLLVIANVSEC